MLWGNITKAQKEFVLTLAEEIQELENYFDVYSECDSLFRKKIDDLSQEEASELIDFLLDERREICAGR